MVGVVNGRSRFRWHVKHVIIGRPVFEAWPPCAAAWPPPPAPNAWLREVGAATPRPAFSFAWPAVAIDERAETLIPPAASTTPISHTIVSPAAERISRLEPT